MPFSIAPLESGVTRLTLEGDLDVFTIDRLRPELVLVTRARPAVVELDFSQLRSTSARGMQVLTSLCTDLARVGSRITITGLRAESLQDFRAALIEAIRHASSSFN